MTVFHFGRGVVCGLALMACVVNVRANIGDTLPQLRGRYGSAQDMDGQMLFEVRLKDGQLAPARGATDTENHYTITVYFDGAHSAMEIFTRNTSDPVKATMPQSDIDSILAASSEGLQWVPVQMANGKPAWMRADKKLLAKFDPSRSNSADDAPVLIIMLNDQH